MVSGWMGKENVAATSRNRPLETKWGHLGVEEGVIHAAAESGRVTAKPSAPIGALEETRSGSTACTT